MLCGVCGLLLGVTLGLFRRPSTPDVIPGQTYVLPSGARVKVMSVFPSLEEVTYYVESDPTLYTIGTAVACRWTVVPVEGAR